jgi:hypothetical protein
LQDSEDSRAHLAEVNDKIRSEARVQMPALV